MQHGEYGFAVANRTVSIKPALNSLPVSAVIRIRAGWAVSNNLLGIDRPDEA